MKTKNKMIALVEIAIVLCSLFLVAMPAIAAEQTTQEVSANTITTTSEDDYVLGVYGNANEDDTIDMGDVVYTKLAIFGKKPKTELCDAKYDGRINVLDVIQTKLIILGKEKELTLIDTAERIVTVKKPLRRAVCLFPEPLETLRSLKVQKDIIVGVAGKNRWDTEFFSEFSEVPSVGWWWNPDIEEILNLRPDAVILISDSRCDATQLALESADPNIAVLRFHDTHPNLYPNAVKKMGYIFGKQDEAEEFLEFYSSILNSIKEVVETILEEDKPKVYFEVNSPYRIWGEYAFIANAGGRDIFVDEPGPHVSVDPEDVISKDPDIIIKEAYTAAGYELDVDNTTELEQIRVEIMSRPELQQVKALKEGKVHIITTRLLCYHPKCGCRHFVQIAYMAKWFHPSFFNDLDPRAIHQEYITRFQGLSYDLDKQGVFVYPEPS